MAGRVVVVGGTGFLGYHAVKELASRGHAVTAIGLTDLPSGCPRPDNVDVVLADLNHTTDDALRSRVAGFDAVVFAAGADDRVAPRSPALEFFRRANVAMTSRVLRLAREGGARTAVVLGSYFAHFAHAWPELRLADRHPYIRSRLEQQDAAAQSGIRTVVLQLPYIFGSAPGLRPLWVPLVRYLKRTPLVLFPRGGTNAVAVQTVAQAIAGAVQGPVDGPVLVGDENLSWQVLLGRMLGELGLKKRVWTLPTSALYPSALIWRLVHRLSGKHSGLDPLHFVALQTRETFFDPTPGRRALGYSAGGLDAAIHDTVRASVAWQCQHPEAAA